MATNKQKTLPFIDGVAPVTVGQEVCYSNGQMGRHFRLNESTVESIGNKLITLKNGSKFYLEDGRKKTDFSSVGLYSSKAAFDRITKESELINKVQLHFRQSYGRTINYEQAVKIAEIIGLDLTENKKDSHE